MYYLSEGSVYYKREKILADAHFVQISGSGYQCYGLDINGNVWRFTNKLVSTARQIKELTNISYVYLDTYSRIVVITNSKEVLEYRPIPNTISRLNFHNIVKVCENLYLDWDGNVFDKDGKIPVPNVKDMFCINENEHLLDHDGQVWIPMFKLLMLRRDLELIGTVDYLLDRGSQVWRKTPISDIILTGYQSLYDRHNNVFVYIGGGFKHLTIIPDVAQLCWHYEPYQDYSTLYIVDTNRTMYEYNVKEERHIADLRYLVGPPIVYAENVDALSDYCLKRNSTKSARN